MKDDGKLAYSIFQQGAGVVHAYDAVSSIDDGYANRGLDSDLDLAGTQHFGGRANQDENGNFYIMDLQGDGYLWDGSYNWTDAYMWSGAYMWSDSLSETMSINRWVSQIGQTLGPLFTSLVYANFGLNSVFYAGALVALTTFLIIFLFGAKGKDHPPV